MNIERYIRKLRFGVHLSPEVNLDLIIVRDAGTLSKNVRYKRRFENAMPTHLLQHRSETTRDEPPPAWPDQNLAGTALVIRVAGDVFNLRESPFS